jgi:hypothetical protein
MSSRIRSGGDALRGGVANGRVLSRPSDTALAYPRSYGLLPTLAAQGPTHNVRSQPARDEGGMRTSDSIAIHLFPKAWRHTDFGARPFVCV